MKKLCVIISLLLATNYCAGAETVKGLVPEAKKIISECLKSSDNQIKANAVEVVAETGSEEMINDVVALLNDPDITVRFAAAIAMGDMKYTDSREKLEKMTKDSDLNVATASSYALYQMGETKYLKTVEDYASSNDQTVKANAVMLLGKAKDKHALPILYQLKNDADSTDLVAFGATEAIARIGDERIYKKVWTMLINVQADVRYMGIQSMASLGGSKGTNAILSMLDDEITEIRLYAAERLGWLGDKSGQSVVLEYFTNPEPTDKLVIDRCNVLAALAIGQIGTEPLTAHLPKLLKNDSPFVKLAAAKSVFMLDKVR